MANNDLEIRIGVILDDVRKGKVELSQAVQEMTAMIDKGNRSSGRSSKSFGEQLETNVIKKFFGARSAARDFFNVLRTFGLPATAFGAILAILNSIVKKTKEARDELKKLREESRLSSTSAGLQGRALDISTTGESIQKRSETLSAMFPKFKPSEIAPIFREGVSAREDIDSVNLQYGILRLAEALGKKPTEVAQSVLQKDVKSFEKITGLTAPPIREGESELAFRERVFPRLFEAASDRARLDNRIKGLEKLGLSTEQIKATGDYANLIKSQRTQEVDIFEQERIEKGNLRERTMRGERFKEIQAENMSEYEKEMLRLQKQNNRNTESLKFGRTNGSRTVLSE